MRMHPEGGPDEYTKENKGQEGVRGGREARATRDGTTKPR